MDIQVDTSKQRPQSGSHRLMLDTGAAAIGRNNKNNNVVPEEDSIDTMSVE